MPANVAEKEAVVQTIQDEFANAKSVVLIDYRGLTVAEVTELRNRYRVAGVDYKVLKNTMIARAINGKPEYEGLQEFLAGPTAVAFATEDAMSAPKITYDFIKEFDKMTVKTGVMDGQVVSADELKTIASLPSREVLLAKLMGSLKAPVSNLVYLLAAIRDKMESEAVAPEAPAQEEPKAAEGKTEAAAPAQEVKAEETAPAAEAKEEAPAAEEAPAEEAKAEKPEQTEE